MMTDFSSIELKRRGTVQYPAEPFNVFDELLIVFRGAVEKQVHDDTEDQRAGDFSNRDGTDFQRHAADTGYQDHGSGEQVAVIVQVDRLEHLQTGDGDEAVQGDADAAHDAAGDRAQEGYEGSEEAGSDGDDRSAQDRDDGSVAGDGHAADGLTIGGVGAAAEEGTGNRTPSPSRVRWRPGSSSRSWSMMVDRFL